MGLNTSIIETRLKAACDHLGQTVTISGTAYRCYPVSIRDNELRNRGQTFREEFQEAISVFDSDVSVSIGDKVTRNGTVRRVMATQESPDNLQTVLYLGKEFGAR